MLSEREFRLFSLAVLGLVGLICVKEASVRSQLKVAPAPTAVELVQENQSASPESPTVQETSASVEVELDSLSEVEEINSGHFQPPYLAGKTLKHN